MPGPFGTAVLDSFTRADSGTLGANWTADISGQGFSSWTIASNTCDASAGGFDSSYWNPSSFGPACEVFCTVTTLPATQELRLLARINNPGGSTVTAYELEVSVGGADTLLYRRDSDVTRVLMGTIGVSVAAGNKLALVCNGTSIQAYKDTGGGWVQIANETDASYSNAGRIGIWNQNNTTLAIDEFGGGDIGGAVGGGAPRMLLLGAG